MKQPAKHLNQDFNYTQSGRLVEYKGRLVRQKLTVTISEGVPASEEGQEDFRRRKLNNQVRPTVQMVFQVDKATVKCVEIKASGGDGFAGVSLQLLAEQDDPKRIAEKALDLWLGEPGHNVWHLSSAPSPAGYGEEVNLLDRRTLREAHIRRTTEEELRDVALTYAMNWERGTKAVMEKFGLKKGTALNRKRAAQKLGLLPPDGSDAFAYEEVVRKLNDGGDSPADDETIKRILERNRNGGEK